MLTCFFSPPGISRTTVRASPVSKISAAGTKYRPGVVFSSLVASSCFSRTARFCPPDILSSKLLVVSVDADGTGLVSLGSRQKHRQDPIAAFGLDAVRVHFNRQGHGAIEAA